MQSHSENTRELSGSAVQTQSSEHAQSQLKSPRMWRTVVHNDPVNLMTYVVWVFMNYFHYPRAKAYGLMMNVHERGRAVVSRGAREKMETDARAMHTYGLWATIEEEEE